MWVGNLIQVQLILKQVERCSTDHEVEGDVAVVEAVEQELKRPPLYKVVMLNDDFTPMDFVVEVLRKFFGMDGAAATTVMLSVHHEGRAVCGIFTKDVAETKAAQVIQYARSQNHPLLCEVVVE